MSHCTLCCPHHVKRLRFKARHIVIVLLICVACLIPAGASAQSDSGWLLKPSLLTALAYDDNIFFSADENPEDDRILRISPALETGYRSAPTAFNIYYTLDAQRYDLHPELDDNSIREAGEMNFSHEATARLTLLADTSLIRTQAPGELDAQSGLELGRTQAERFYISPAAIYEINRLTRGSASYTFNRDEVDGGIGSETSTLALHLDRLISRRDTFRVGYHADQFEFETGETVDMHVLLLGGTRQFTPQTSVTLMAGSRFTEGEQEDETDPEVAAALMHEFSRGDFGLTYTRRQTTTIGLAGTADTQNLTAALIYPLGNSLGVRAETSYITSELNGFEADAVVTDVEIGYRFSDYLTLIGAYEFNSQTGSLETDGFGEINRNVVWLGLVIAPPVRTDSAWWRRERATSTVLDEPTLRRRESRLESER
jgi:hypothetical protein